MKLWYEDYTLDNIKTNLGNYTVFIDYLTITFLFSTKIKDYSEIYIFLENMYSFTLWENTFILWKESQK